MKLEVLVNKDIPKLEECTNETEIELIRVKKEKIWLNW